MMEDGGPTAGYIIFFVLLLIDFLFYGFGAAVKELNAKELSEAAEGEKKKKAKRLYAIYEKPAQYINTVQLVVSVVNLIMGGYFLSCVRLSVQNFLGNKIIKGLFDMQINPEVLSVMSLLLSGFILLYILLTFGVLLPKKLGAKYAMKWAYTLVNPIYYVTILCAPVTGLISLTCKGGLRLFGIHGDEDVEDVTEEEIISMVNEGHEQGVLLATEAEMITNIFEFGDKEAQNIMTHRKNILALDKSITLKEALDYMVSESKSRFPVYHENIDQIVGILHFRDVMRAHRLPENLEKPIGEIEGLIRDAMFIPETKNIDALFKTMQQEKIQMVIVVDEYGQTSGLLAMEDILEEIVGNIMDEYDEDEEYIEETENADEYIIDGITPLEELEEKFGLSFEEEEFETVNGFMISRMERIPEEDEQFSTCVGGYEFQILAVENRMIKSVLVRKLKDEPQKTDGLEDASEKESKDEDKGE